MRLIDSSSNTLAIRFVGIKATKVTLLLEFIIPLGIKLWNKTNKSTYRKFHPPKEFPKENPFYFKPSCCAKEVRVFITLLMPL